MNKTIKSLAALLLLAATTSGAMASEEAGYREPAQVLKDMALAPVTPTLLFDDNYTMRLELTRNTFISLAELAQTELRLAGVRFNPDTYSESRRPGFSEAKLVNMKNGQETAITGLPAGKSIWCAEFYNSDQNVLIGVREDDGIYLYSAAVSDGAAKRVTDYRLHQVMSSTSYGVASTASGIVWTGKDSFVMQAVPMGQHLAPAVDQTPKTPVIQENLGKSAPARTYQDLLKNEADEQLFDFYFTSQLVSVTPDGAKEIGKPAIYSSVSASPDKQYLLTKAVERPYSYMVPYYSFPSTTAIIDLEGNNVKTLINTPQVTSAMGRDTTSPYARNHGWRADKPASIYWVEALDGGNPKGKELEYLDAVYQLDAPFTGEKTEIVKTPMRFGGIQWCDDEFALISQRLGSKHLSTISSFKPCSGEALKEIFSWSTEDSYANPGRPVMVEGPFGKDIVYAPKNHTQLLMMSEGASPEGDMPLLSRYTIPTQKKEILWQCKAPYYEHIMSIHANAKVPQFITSRESQNETANFHLYTIGKKGEKQITNFGNPYPMLEGVTKQKIKYKRADGLDLTATVYLPAGYDKERDGRLPVFMFAYPREYRSAADAAQVRGSQYTFPVLTYRTPAFWVTRGYCVMENVEMPIVGSETEEPNDHFIDQLVMDAEAAVKVIHEMGVGDTARIGIGGHSYGAFMTANLMTHTKLFKAGIARCGAYNRTLTPFGFQSETRTYWEAKEVYDNMSPFMYADKLSGALLLVHGELDSNSGTFPIQTERFYQALKGHKATVRYVVLPLESHHFSARENMLHLLWEQDMWLEKYVKNAGKE